MPKCIQCRTPFIEQIDIINMFKCVNNICESCKLQWAEAQINVMEHCKRCLKRKCNSDVVCKDCLYLAQRYNLMEQLYCRYNYSGVVKKTLQQYKFMRDYALKEVIAQRITFPSNKYDYIIPIPSPRDRDIERTFNVVTTVLDELDIKYLPCVEAKYKLKQSSLTKKQRAKQVNPFEIISIHDFTDRYILLVDDIYTTGITVHQVACKFFERKIRKFDVFTFAR
jgi:competence protein ComFC